MRKALIVGIDYYERLNHLRGCVNDANSVRGVIERHGDETVNFHTQVLTGSGIDRGVTKIALKDAIKDLFQGDGDIGFFYFAGHGSLQQDAGYILASDSEREDDGIDLDFILKLSNKSRFKNRVIVLDSCHSGAAGDSDIAVARSTLEEGMTILTASTKDQYALESNGSGVFTRLFVNALNGSAANLLGDITPGSVYAHIDQSLGAWDQRPLFKTNIKQFVSLRKVKAPIPLSDLRALVSLFPTVEHEFVLDPSFEPESDFPNPENVEKFQVLQRCNRVGLVVPVGAPHMYHAAIGNKGCKLTVLGMHYWNLAKRKLI